MKKKILDKENEILRLACGKRTLHLGCVGFTDLDKDERVRYAKQTLHWKLSENADVTGIDYSREVINSYKELGIFENIIYGDAEKLGELNLAHNFDVIIAGDIIEHLSNPGLMLQGINSISNENTILILTTPNAFGIFNFLRFLLSIFKEGNEHVMMFNEFNMINLLKRYQFEIIASNTCYQSNAKGKKLFQLGKQFLTLFPKLGGTLFVIAKKSK